MASLLPLLSLYSPLSSQFSSILGNNANQNISLPWQLPKIFRMKSHSLSQLQGLLICPCQRRTYLLPLSYSLATTQPHMPCFDAQHAEWFQAHRLGTSCSWCLKCTSPRSTWDFLLLIFQTTVQTLPCQISLSPLLSIILLYFFIALIFIPKIPKSVICSREFITCLPTSS